MIFLVSWATWALLCVLTVALTIKLSTRTSKHQQKEAPGPIRWPLIGSIPFMAKYATTTEAFSVLARDYGDIATLKLGTVNSIVVSGVQNILDVLIDRAHQFDSRPDFLRYDMLFEGNRNNSLAFADWSENQKKRREIVGHHSFPKKASPRFDVFQDIAMDHISEMMNNLKSCVTNSSEETHFLKFQILESIFKTFLKYFCGMEVTSKNRQDFLQILNILDDIFQEVNAPCLGDIFPAFMPFCNKSHLTKVGAPIRKFMIKHCVEPKRAAAANTDENNNETVTELKKSSDLLDEFLNSIGKDSVTEETALFALEDMIAGHAAIGNMLTAVCYFLGQNPEVQSKIRQEVAATRSTNDNPILITDNLSYTEAVIWEAVRHIGSSLVPHVANTDTHLGDFTVKKGTVLFLNNGDLNSSPQLWDEPDRFEPDRFLKGGQVLKPDHYFPFGTGRRSCLGFKLLLYTSILIVSNLCSSFEIGLVENDTCKWKQGTLAVPGQGFKFTLRPLTGLKL